MSFVRDILIREPYESSSLVVFVYGSRCSIRMAFLHIGQLAFFEKGITFPPVSGNLLVV